MTQNSDSRLPWTTPQLRRIEAGSAEVQANPKGTKDNGPTSDDKS